MSSIQAPAYRLGVDVGGTFTDLLLINEATGETYPGKVPSTPADSSIGVLNGIASLCTRHAIDPRHISHVMHGTTVAINIVFGTASKTVPWSATTRTSPGAPATPSTPTGSAICAWCWTHSWTAATGTARCMRGPA